MSTRTVPFSNLDDALTSFVRGGTPLSGVNRNACVNEEVGLMHHSVKQRVLYRPRRRSQGASIRRGWSSTPIDSKSLVWSFFSCFMFLLVDWVIDGRYVYVFSDQSLLILLAFGVGDVASLLGCSLLLAWDLRRLFYSIRSPLSVSVSVSSRLSPFATTTTPPRRSFRAGVGAGAGDGTILIRLFLYSSSISSLSSCRSLNTPGRIHNCDVSPSMLELLP